MKIVKKITIISALVGTLASAPLVWVEFGSRFMHDPDAQRVLARWYQEGAWFHSVDKTVARSWLLKAVDQNNVQAQYDLALDYEAERHFDEAASWYTKLANANYVPAQYALGNLFLGYSGAVRRPDQARYWLNKAATAGSSNAQLVLGVTYMGGEQDFLIEPQIGAQWIQAAANQNNARAQYVLAGLYGIGNGVPQSNELAITWAKKSLDAGYADAGILLKNIQTTQQP